MAIVPLCPAKTVQNERLKVKNSRGFSGIRTHDLCDVGAIPYQVSNLSRVWNAHFKYTFLSLSKMLQSHYIIMKQMKNITIENISFFGNAKRIWLCGRHLKSAQKDLRKDNDFIDLP